MNDERVTLEEVRRRLVNGHSALRAALDALDVAAGRVLSGGGSSVLELQAAIERVCALAREQLDLEDTTLMPFLRKLGTWGGRRTDEVLDDHRQQREVLTALEDESRSGCKLGDALADDACWVARSIARDVVTEEVLLRRLEVGLASTAMARPLGEPSRAPR
jgi:hypothetical protein